MLKKFVALATTILIICFSVIATCALPPRVPGIFYDNGPLSPLLAQIDLSPAEKAAYALYEGIMLVAEAKIHATSCSSAIDTYDVTIFTDGTQNNRPFNFVDVFSFGGSFTLSANLYQPIAFRGQKIKIHQDGSGLLADTVVSGLNMSAIYNEPSNMMVQYGYLNVKGANGRLNRYKSTTIKDFIRGSPDSNDYDYYTILDWGLGTVHKLGYPVNKFWQRSKSRRSDGDPARTVYVKDRLVGTSACRITIDTMGENNQDIFWQEGAMTIELVDPSYPVSIFGEFPFEPEQ